MNRLSALQRLEVVDPQGRRIGRVFDLKTTLGPPGSPPRLEGMLVGRGGLARRLGIRRGSARLIPFSAVRSIDEKRVVVSESA